MRAPCWLRWAAELQSLAQAGLWYSRDPYDIERFERIRDIAAEIMAHGTDEPVERVRNLFCNESGYQTPKIETRAAIFEDGKILLVRENDGLWSLPGGWADIGLSVGENAVKEVREEAGLEARAERIIAVLDHAKHNRPAQRAQHLQDIHPLLRPRRALRAQHRDDRRRLFRRRRPPAPQRGQEQPRADKNVLRRRTRPGLEGAL